MKLAARKARLNQLLKGKATTRLCRDKTISSAALYPSKHSEAEPEDLKSNLKKSIKPVVVQQGPRQLARSSVSHRQLKTVPKLNRDIREMTMKMKRQSVVVGSGKL